MKNYFFLLLFIVFSKFTFSQLNFQEDFLIVRLNHNLLNLDFVDDESKKTFKLQEVLNNEGLETIKTLNDSLINYLDLETIKIFSNLKIKDSISISRQGNKVYTPPFWATFKIKKPTNIKLLQFQNIISNAYPLIIYAHPNYIGEYENAPNDEFYINQLSINSENSEATIKVEGAWEKETGKNFIKVGVFDTGIDNTHEDLNILSGYSYYDDVYNPTIDCFEDNNGHGTQVAGIIGAKRNNSETGIAGIAGGDGSLDSGVSMLAFKLGAHGSFSAEGMSIGLIDASRSPNDSYYWSNNATGVINKTGYGINIANHSYSLHVDASNKKENKLEFEGGGTGVDSEIETGWNYCYLCREAFLFSLKNGVTNVVARGNRTNFESNSNLNGTNKYPASFDDSWVINVGSSGTDGNWLDRNLNGASYENYHSYLGGNIDLVAPGTEALVVTTKSSFNNLSGEKYKLFNGSSAAAPHVTGVAALLLSKYNKKCYSNINIDPADVEYILQKSAVDIEDTDYDNRSGWGRLDAEKAMDMIDFPRLQIVHPTQNPISVEETDSDEITIFLNQPLHEEENGPLGNNFPLELNLFYKVERKEYTLTYNFSNYIQSSTTLLDTWIRHSQTNSLQYLEDVRDEWGLVGNTGTYGWVQTYDTFKIEPMAEIINVDLENNKIDIRGFYYHFVGKYEYGIGNETTIEDFWYPIKPSDGLPKMAYSLYIKDLEALSRYDFPCDSSNDLNGGQSILSVNELSQNYFDIFPNPGNELTINQTSNIMNNGKYYITDNNGNVLQTIDKNSTNKYFNVETKRLSSGIYFITFINDNNLSQTKKWIKL